MKLAKTESPVPQALPDIGDEKEYNRCRQQFKKLMDSSKLTRDDTRSLKQLIDRIAAYEEQTYAVPGDPTIAGILKRKMADLDMDQRTLAVRLGIHYTALNQVMRGRRRPTLALIKKMNTVLSLDGNYLLKHA